MALVKLKLKQKLQNQIKRDLNNNINQDKEVKKSKKQHSSVLTISSFKGHFTKNDLLIFINLWIF